VRGGHTCPASGRDPWCREKPLASRAASVPQTDTGGLVEDTKVDGRPLVKELGKLTP
jgi:N-formylglutamate amidohydrolase